MDTQEEKKESNAGRPLKITKLDLTTLNKAVEEACEIGFTDDELAEALAIDQQTLQNYKKRFPEFFESIKRGKNISDDAMEVSLFHRGIGYSHPDVHISTFEGLVIKTPIIKHYPPDFSSMRFWLMNRRKETWRDKHEVEFSKPLEVIIRNYDGKTLMEFDLPAEDANVISTEITTKDGAII